MTLSKLRHLLTGMTIDDIIITGFIDRNATPVRFRALSRTLYFECGDMLLKFSVVDDTGRMMITKAETVSCDADLDDDMEPACTSLHQAVRDPSEGLNSVASVRLWHARDAGPGIECAAIRFDLTNGQRIFLDPSYHYGFRIGGLEQQRIWLENSLHTEHDCVAMTVFGTEA